MTNDITRGLLRAAFACALVASASCTERRAGTVDTPRGTAGGAPPAGPATREAIGPAAPAGEAATSFPEPLRPVASIVAPRWTNEDARDDAGEFSRVAKIAGVVAGTHVADIGAGDGYYVTRLSPMVGASGLVYGEDIVSDYLALLQERLQREKFTNTRVVRGEAHDPRLPANSLDVALMIHMYHEIDQPFGLLYNLAPSLKANGRVVILDLDRPTFGHGTPPALVRCELRAVGYTEVSFTRSGGEEYVLVFQAPDAATRPSPADIRASLAASPCKAVAE